MKTSATNRANPRSSLGDRRAALFARHPKLAERNLALALSASPLQLTTLGADDSRRPLSVDDATRCEHLHAIGATGSGKSTLLLNCILQDIARGRGVAVLDPHGGHPDSLINTVLRFLTDHGWLGARNVHILSPNIREFIVGFNPLAPLPDTDVSVIADAMLKAFERAWGDEDTHQKPTTRSLLKAIFMALIELGMNLSDAKFLLDHKDRHGVRARAIATLENEYARDELDALHQLSLAHRSAESFRANVIGPVNRLNEFVSSDALRIMLGMNREQATPDNTIDLLDIINRGHILLVDLQHAGAVSESDTDLLGKILLRYLFMLMSHRQPYRLDDGVPKFHPFFVYVDECHRYMTDDVEGLLAEARKYGIGVNLAHQYLAQLGKPGERIYEAVRNSTHIKAVFRINSAEEAQALAHDLIPLDVEMPVKASVRPTVVGHTVEWLNNESYGVQESEGENYAEITSEALAHGRTEMHNWARSLAHSVGRSSGEVAGTSTADTSGGSQAHTSNLTYDPQSGIFTPTKAGTADTVGASAGHIAAAQHSVVSSRSESTSLIQTESGGLAHSETEITGRAVHRGRSKQRGTTKSDGRTQSTIPAYQKLPTSFHSLEHVKYMAGETIRNLPTGRAVLRFRRTVTFLNVPPPRRRK